MDVLMHFRKVIEGDRMAYVYKRIIHRYPKEKRYTLAMLQDIQRENGFISQEAMEYISKYLNLPMSHIYNIATFYKALSLRPKGKHIIRICNGTACHIRGADSIKEELFNMLGIRPGETSKDGLFSLEVVNCLGACALAPVIVIDNKYYGKLTKEKLKAVVAQYKGAEVHG